MADVVAQISAEAKSGEDLAIVRQIAQTLHDRIATMSGHAARTLLCRLVEDLVAHPAEIGSAVAVLRIIDRGTPRPGEVI